MRKALGITVRVVVALVGAGALVWGALIAGFEQQPAPLIVVGLLLIVGAWVGNNWQEISARFGDSSFLVRRAVANAEAVIESVEQAVRDSPDLPDTTRDSLLKTSEEAKTRLKSGKKKRYSPEVGIKVSLPTKSGKRRISLTGYRPFDWTVSQEIRFAFGGSAYRASVSDNNYTRITFPDDFVKVGESDASIAQWWVESIYGGDGEVFASVPISPDTGTGHSVHRPTPPTAPEPY
jgi:hypothetical protein